MKFYVIRHLRVVLPITIFSLACTVGGSALQKIAIGVPLAPCGFVMPALSGTILGALLGIWMALDRVKQREILERSQQIEALNTEVLRRENELGILLEEKEMLLAEVHHRVRNLLQLLSSIVSLDISLCGDELNRADAFAAFQRRIESIATVYDQLIDPRRSLDIHLPVMVHALVAHVPSRPVSIGPPEFDLRIDECALPIGQSIPPALIISKGITNACGDGSIRRASIYITIDTSYCRVRFSTGDDGIGKSERFGCKDTLSVGIVRAPAEQLRGTVHQIVADPILSAFDLSFPLVGTVTIDPSS